MFDEINLSIFLVTPKGMQVNCNRRISMFTFHGSQYACANYWQAKHKVSWASRSGRKFGLVIKISYFRSLFLYFTIPDSCCAVGCSNRRSQNDGSYSCSEKNI